jgi:hypothetical protein
VSTGLSRRAFLGSVLGAGAVAIPLAAASPAAASTSTLYLLNPDWGAGNPTCVPNHGQIGCGGCYACVAHYHNKLFASAAAADAGRAHPRCKCLVQEAFTVDPGTYDELFVNGTSVDRRTAGVNALLAQSTAAPVSAAADGTAGVVSASSGSLAFTGAPLLPLAAAGAGAVALGAVMLRSSRARPADVPETGG